MQRSSIEKIVTAFPPSMSIPRLTGSVRCGLRWRSRIPRKLAAINKDFTERADECCPNANPPEIEAKRSMGDSDGSEAMVTHEWQLAQKAQSTEACRQREIGE